MVRYVLLALVAPWQWLCLAMLLTKHVNMLTIIQIFVSAFGRSKDPFDVLKGFIQREKMIQMVVECDNRTLMPLLVAIFQFQNLSIIGHIEPSMVDNEKSPLGQ
jgi:hypothetical protein